MILESKMSDPLETGAKPAQLIKYYNGEWLTFTQIANLPEMQEKGVSYDILWVRWNRLNYRDDKDLFRKKRKKKKHAKKDIYALEEEPQEPKMILYDFGYHGEKGEDEIFAGHLSASNFTKSDYWNHQRLGLNKSLSGDTKGKFPYFLNKQEVIDRGWIIIPTN